MVQMFMRDLKKVSALDRVSALERFCYKRFLGRGVRLGEVSALEDVRLREVPLYFVFDRNSKNYLPGFNKCKLAFRPAVSTGANTLNSNDDILSLRLRVSIFLGN